jgi:hypothetical protein
VPGPSWTNGLLPWAYRRAIEGNLSNQTEDGAAAAGPAPDG